MLSEWIKEYSVVNRILFPYPRPPTYNVNDFPNELCFIPRDGCLDSCPTADSVPCLVLPVDSSPYIVLYCHGNAEDLGVTFHFADALRENLNVHIVAVEYPGYGVSNGSPTEASLNADLKVVFDFFVNVLKWPSDKILLFGRSIGTGPTTALASEVANVGGLILMSPYTSIRDVARHLVGGFAAALMVERFNNRKLIEGVKCPTLVIHGLRDSLIPHSHAIELFECCGAAKKKLVVPPTMDHHEFFMDVDILDPIMHFFNLRGPRCRLLMPQCLFMPPAKTSTNDFLSVACCNVSTKPPLVLDAAPMAPAHVHVHHGRRRSHNNRQRYQQHSGTITSPAH